MKAIEIRSNRQIRQNKIKKSNHVEFQTHVLRTPYTSMFYAYFFYIFTDWIILRHTLVNVNYSQNLKAGKSTDFL